MMARGFKPVGWVAAVAGAALGCYMLSLNVASERAELAKLERRIIAAKQDIRSLQTELGTRGRMQQLEHWNANVLALSAPTSGQFLENEVTLAKFDVRAPSLEDKAKVRLASADAPKAENKPRVTMAAADVSPKDAHPLVQRAALVVANSSPEVRKASLAMPVAAKPAMAKVAADMKPASSKKLKMIDDALAKAIGEAAKFEKSGAAGGQ